MDLSLTHMLSRCTRFVLCSLLALLIPPALVAQTLGPDVTSGYVPGEISVFAGAGTGAIGTPAISAAIGPLQLAFDSHGNLYFSDGQRVYIIYEGGPVLGLLAYITTQVDPTNVPVVGNVYGPVAGLATGQGTYGAGAPASQTPFAGIAAITFSQDGLDTLYIADGAYSNAIGGPANVVYAIAQSTTIVSTVAGQFFSQFGADIGEGGLATSATLYNPYDVRVDSANNVYIADQGDDIVRVVYGGVTVPPILVGHSPAVVAHHIYTVAGQNGVYCSSIGTCGSNGTAATSALFDYLYSVAVDAAGNLYILDGGSGTLRVVYANGAAPPILSTVTSTNSITRNTIYTVAGTEFNNCTAAVAPAITTCGDGGPALAGSFNNPSYVTVDDDGNSYIADTSDNTVRKVDYSGYISTVAGMESPGQNPPIGIESGLSTSVSFNQVPGIAFDAAHNNLYIADNDGLQDSHNLIWKATPAAAQTITFNALTPVTYGASPIALHATSTSGLPVTYAVTSGPGTINGSTLTITGGGTITITASQAGGPQTVNGTTTYYQAATATQTLSVNPATLTITAEPATKLFGQPNPTFLAPVTGFVSPDNQGTVLTGSPGFVLTPPADTNSSVGTYVLTPTLGTLTLKPAYTGDYNLVHDVIFVSSTLTITGDNPQTITFAPLATVTYGSTSTIALTATASSGLPVTYSITSGTAASISGSTLTILGAGSVTIQATQSGNNFYVGATAVTRTLTINPAPLTVTAPSFTLTYGSPIVYPAPVITGFVGSDTQASAISGSPMYSTTATTTSPIGTYQVTIVGRGSLTASANYVLPMTYGTGTLTIIGDLQTISFNPLYSQVYGYAAPPPTAIASSGLPVTFTLTGPAYFTNGQGGLSVGSTITTNPSAGQNSVYFGTTGVGTVTITASQSGNTQYAAAPSVTQTVTITPAPLTVLANNFTREFGAPNPVFTFQIGSNTTINGQGGGFVNGDSDVPSVIQGAPLVTTTATQDSPPGTYPIQISANTLVAPNYTFVFFPGTLTILPAGSYTITSSPASLTIPAGESRQASITVTPVNLYQGTVTLSCGQLPANVTCIFSPSNYTFTGATNSQGNAANAAQGTLTINTVGGQTVVGSIAPTSSSVERASFFLLPTTIAGLLLFFRRRQLARYSAFRQMCLLAALAIGALTLSSCGSTSNSSTGAIAAPGTANVVITGVGTTADGSGSVTSSMTLSVTIQ